MATAVKERRLEKVPEAALLRCKSAFEFVVARSGEKDQLRRTAMPLLFTKLGLLKVSSSSACTPLPFPPRNDSSAGCSPRQAGVCPADTPVLALPVVWVATQPGTRL
jgi:hypothetical protein